MALSKIAILIVCISLLSGCRSISTFRTWWGGDESAAVAEDIIVPLTLLQGAPTSTNKQQLQSIVDEFSLVNEAITVTVRYENNYTNLLTRGNPPIINDDLFLIDSFLLPDLVKLNVVQPLPPAFVQSGVVRLDDFYPTLLDAFTIDGRLYCLPREFRTLAIVYNKALFDEANIAYPREGWTWAEFRATAETISEIKNTYYSIYGLALSTDASRWLPFLYQNGGALLTPDRQTSTINSPEALDAMNFYMGLIEDGIAAPTSTLMSSWSGEAIGTGRVGMVIEGNWIQPYLDAEFPDLAYGITPLPVGTAGSATIAFSSCYALSAHTQHLNEAMALLQFLSTPVNMRLLSHESVAIPSRLSLQSEWVQQHTQLMPFLDGVEYARPWRFAPNYQLVIDSISNNMKRTVAAEIPSEEILRVAEKLSNEALTR